MAYADVDELAAALRIRVNPQNTTVLQACLDAASQEIDHWLDRIDDDPLDDPAPALVNRTNVNRAVEWFKATDAANGMAGFEQVGLLTPPKDGFERHADAIIPFKQQWGLA